MTTKIGTNAALVAGALACAGLLAVGCKKSGDTPQPATGFDAQGQAAWGAPSATGQPQGAWGQPAAAAPSGAPTGAWGAPTATAAPPPTATAAAPDLASMVTGALAQGAAALGALQGPGGDAVDVGLKQVAAQAAPGAKATGAAQKLMLQPGQHGTASVQIPSGKCVTIVGFSMLGVQAYAIRLQAAAPMSPIPPMEGVTNGAGASIGAAPNCIRNPLPMAIPAQVDVEIKAGQGQVGVQVFAK